MRIWILEEAALMNNARRFLNPMGSHRIPNSESTHARLPRDPEFLPPNKFMTRRPTSFFILIDRRFPTFGRPFNDFAVKF